MKMMTKRCIQGGLILVVLLALGGIIKKQFFAGSHKSGSLAVTQGEIKKMMGIKSTSPEKLSTYQTVSGVLNIAQWVTKQGVRVYFVKINTLPIVDVELGFDAGAARGAGGLAYLTNTLIAEGTAQLSADQVAENFDNVGALFQTDSQRDMAIVHLRSLSTPEQLIPAVQTLGAILSQPLFPEGGFKREKQNALSRLKRQAQQPQSVASRALYTALYKDQPYGNWVLGDEASLAAITLEEVRNFYKKYYTAKNAVVTIVGDLSLEDADAIAQAVSNNLPEGEKAPVLAPVTPLASKVVQKIDFPSAQTHIVMGQLGLKQSDPDYYALMVGNHILGGNGSVTRIFNTIRGEHGLAYSAYSQFMPMRELGPFVLGCQTRNDQAEKSLSLMQKVLTDFVTQGPTDKELDQAKKNLLGSYALRFDNNLSICREVGSMAFYGLPFDYFNQFKPTVAAVTLDQIKQAFQKRISDEKLVIVTVGGSPDKLVVNEPPAAAVPQGSVIPGSMQH